MDIVERIITLFGEGGGDAYFGEAITQSEHALQSAWFARDSGRDGQLAALLHDIGHLLHRRGEDAADRGIDARHERIGAAWLARYFPPSITEPIALHVDAKRYLCARDAAYEATLSTASVQSLRLQGGPLDEAACLAFERHAHWREAVALRRCDDQAKIVDLEVPGWDRYVELLRAASAT